MRNLCLIIVFLLISKTTGNRSQSCTYSSLTSSKTIGNTVMAVFVNPPEIDVFLSLNFFKHERFGYVAYL